MNRKGQVFFQDALAGHLRENDEGYVFEYDQAYLEGGGQAISFTFPVHDSPFVSKTMFPVFDGLIPEGWLLDIAEISWKIDRRDRMGLLLAVCRDCIGAVSIREAP